MSGGQRERVLIYGLFGGQHLGGTWERAFQTLGHEVFRFDSRELAVHLPAWQRHRVGHRLTIRSLRMRRLAARRWQQHLVRTVSESEPRLLFVLNGDYLMPETVRQIRKLGTAVYIFHADNPFPPFPAGRPETIPIARESDCYFIWSRSLLARLREAGVKNVEYLPFAWDPEVFPRAPAAAEPAHDIVFIGNWDREREHFLTHLARNFRVRIWGPTYWRDRTAPGSPLRKAWQGSEILQHDAARVVANARVMLNVLRTQNLPDGTNMRTFEIPGSGGFLLSNRTVGAMEIYPEGEAGAYFGGTEELIERAGYYLSHERERREIAAAGRRVTEEGHQYVHRAQQVIGRLRGH